MLSVHIFIFLCFVVCFFGNVCLRLMSYVPNVVVSVSVPVLSIRDCPFGFLYRAFPINSKSIMVVAIQQETKTEENCLKLIPLFVQCWVEI